MEEKSENNPGRTRTFEFEPHQVTMADAALLLGISYQDVQTLIKMGYLKAEGRRPYKIDVRSVVEYKRAMPNNNNVEEDDDDTE